MATITDFSINKYFVDKGINNVYSFKFAGAYCNTNCNNQAEIEQKLTSGEWKLIAKDGSNALWCGPVQNVDIDALKPFLAKRKTLSDALATVFPQDVKAAAAF
jgi:hypothetical protein